MTFRILRIILLVIISMTIEATFFSEFSFVFRNRLASNSQLSVTKCASVLDCAVTCKMTETCVGLTFNPQNSMCVLFSFCPDVTCDTMVDDQGSETFCSIGQRLRDCKALHEAGYTVNSIYVLYPYGRCQTPVWAQCDMTTDGGGWTIFQRRYDGTENFTQDWSSYANGFGNPFTEYWLGNAVINHLTGYDASSLYIMIKPPNGEWKYARYADFHVTMEADYFRLFVENYSGDAGDSLQSSYSPTTHDGRDFSTYDRDNDASTDNCALDHHGGWWYNRCHATNLNGLYCGDAAAINSRCNTWSTYNGSHLGLEQSIMMFRRH